jgi:hypothetical protein
VFPLTLFCSKNIPSIISHFEPVRIPAEHLLKSFRPSVHPYARNNSRTTERIFKTSDTGETQCVDTFQFWLKSGKSKRQFISRLALLSERRSDWVISLLPWSPWLPSILCLPWLDVKEQILDNAPISLCCMHQYRYAVCTFPNSFLGVLYVLS